MSPFLKLTENTVKSVAIIGRLTCVFFSKSVIHRPYAKKPFVCFDTFTSSLQVVF